MKPIALFLISLTAGAQSLDEYLANARAAWGIDISIPVRIVMDDIGPCSLTPEGVVTALTQITETRTTFDGVTTVNRTVLIRINSECNWGKDKRLSLQGTVMHEWGHVLTGDHLYPGYHSSDPRSIMYYIVRGDGKQSITADDMRVVSGAYARMRAREEAAK